MVASSYFIGFSLGFFLFPLPERFGRKRVMTILMILYLFSTGLVSYSNTLSQKSIGFFAMGILHLKITVSYTHIFELIDDDHKGFCATVLNMVDAITLAVVGFCFIFVTRDGVRFMEVTFLVSSIFVVLYFVLVPESPSWLLSTDQQEEALKSLNYIAKFNGSHERIPLSADFDVVS